MTRVHAQAPLSLAPRTHRQLRRGYVRVHFRAVVSRPALRRGEARPSRFCTLYNLMDLREFGNYDHFEDVVTGKAASVLVHSEATARLQIGVVYFLSLQLAIGLPRRKHSQKDGVPQTNAFVSFVLLLGKFRSWGKTER